MDLGGKIKEIRKHLGLSQENIAHYCGCGVATISRIERGLSDCDSDMLKAIKRALGIEGAPLFEEESAAFHERFYVWGQLMSDRRLEDAKELNQELSVILKLPFEKSLIMLYRLFSVQFLLTCGEYDAAEEMLDELTNELEDMENEHLYHYYRVRNVLSFRRGDYKSALKFVLKALELKEYNLGSLAGLYYSVAVGYSCLSRPLRAILYLEEARRHHNDDRLSVLSVFIDHVFALNYLRIDELNRAKVLLDKALLKAESIGRKLGRKKYIGMILHLLGYYHQKRNEPEQALRYYNRAYEFFYVSSLDHMENTYRKINCLIELKRQGEAKTLLSQALDEARHNEVFTVVFEALRRTLSLRENGAANYLEEHSLPFLLNRSEFFYALDFCHLLEKNYMKTGNNKKSLEISRKIRLIYEDIFLGE
ncbi:MAG: helix-turn-helix domain-containing protein [Defluviitaleaceae bacterium]|nr:helix-turn-helix domain-containing protein [Defluviitaleaceae bacterium]